MAKDTNLALLTTATAYTASGVIGAGEAWAGIRATEGGFMVAVRVYAGAMTGTNPTCDLDIQVRRDGTNWRSVGKFPQLVDTDDNVEIARLAYIPRPDSGQAVTSIRLYATIGGTTPSFTFNRVDVEPLVSLGVPAADETLGIGLAKLASV